MKHVLLGHLMLPLRSTSHRISGRETLRGVMAASIPWPPYYCASFNDCGMARNRLHHLRFCSPAPTAASGNDEDHYILGSTLYTRRPHSCCPLPPPSPPVLLFGVLPAPSGQRRRSWVHRSTPGSGAIRESSASSANCASWIVDCSFASVAVPAACRSPLTHLHR